MSRPSKIGQLPAALRNELNQRLEDGQQAKSLVPWLNKKAEAHFSAAAASGDPDDPDSEPVEFSPVTEQNLSDWRRGGFVEWQLLNGIYDASARLGEASDEFAEIDLDSKRFMTLLKARFAASLLAWDGTNQGNPYHTMNLVLRLTKGVLTMRRSEQLDERRELDLQRLELTRESRGARPQRPTSSSSSSAKSRPKSNAANVPEPVPAAPRAPGVPPPLPDYVLQPQQEQTPVAPTAQPAPSTAKPSPSASPAPATASVAAPGLVTPQAQSAAANPAPAAAPVQPAQPPAPQKPAAPKRPLPYPIWR